jgi:NAD(P)-dependent dehydrogenase (short-subunit alcohol dehydrogenase family)
VTDREGLERVFGEAAERFGGIDAVVANAGIASGGTVEVMQSDAFERVIEVNLLGAYRTISVALPHLVKSRGYLLSVASVAAIGQAPLMAAYSAAKAGLEALSNSLRLEVAHKGVGVGVAYFSWLGTELTTGADDHPSFALMRAKLSGPTGKTYPVSKAAEAIADGIERRSDRVYTPGWIRGMIAVRGFMPLLLGRLVRNDAPEIVAAAEAEARERGDAAYEPVGAGGKAFARSREERV